MSKSNSGDKSVSHDSSIATEANDSSDSVPLRFLQEVTKVAMPEGCWGYRVEYEGRTAVRPVFSEALEDVGYYG